LATTTPPSPKTQRRGFPSTSTPLTHVSSDGGETLATTTPPSLKTQRRVFPPLNHFLTTPLTHVSSDGGETLATTTPPSPKTQGRGFPSTSTPLTRVSSDGGVTTSRPPLHSRYDHPSLTQNTTEGFPASRPLLDYPSHSRFE